MQERAIPAEAGLWAQGVLWETSFWVLVSFPLDPCLRFAEHAGISPLLPRQLWISSRLRRSPHPSPLLHGQALDFPLLSPGGLLLPSPVLGKLGRVLLTESAFFICLSEVGVCSPLGSVPALGAKDTAKKVEEKARLPPPPRAQITKMALLERPRGLHIKARASLAQEKTLIPAFPPQTVRRGKVSR